MTITDRPSIIPAQAGIQSKVTITDRYSILQHHVRFRGKNA